MKITYKGDYALKAVLDLAIHYDRELITSHDLAKHIDAPVKFLEQVLLDLKKAGFVFFLAFRQLFFFALSARPGLGNRPEKPYHKKDKKRRKLA